MRKITILGFIIFTMTLQGQSKLLSSINEFFDGTTWQYTSGANYDYDSNNNLLSESQLFWDPSSSKWSVAYIYSYTYNSSNLATMEIGQSRDFITNQLENSYQSINTYDGENITEQVSKTWENGAWKNEYKSTFTYSGGRIVGALSYEWNGTDWDPEDRSTVTYDNNDFNTIVTEDWDGTMWVTGDRQLFTYNSNNRIIRSIYESWDGSKWVEEDRTDYVIDANGNKTKETNIYDGSTFEENFMYDMGALMSSFVHPFKDKTGLDYIVEGNPYHNKLLSTTNNNSGRTTYNYNSLIVLGIEDFKIVNDNIKVYPIPTSGNMTIESLKADIKNVEIYNTLGSRVFSTQDTKFNIDFLKAGVYFLNMTSNDDVVYTRKIIKN